ncbi:MAG: hypothetical protein ACR2QV_03750 [Gammaproteobacteria bacterium]
MKLITRTNPSPVRIALLCFALLCFALASPHVAAADRYDIGRLFMTPAQRAELDAQRQRSPGADITVATPRPDAVALRDDIRLNGIVRRSSGPATIWVNGRALDQESADLAGIDVRHGLDAGNRVTLSLDNGRALALKPGQSWLSDTDQIVDCTSCAPRPDPEPNAGAAESD